MFIQQPMLCVYDAAAMNTIVMKDQQDRMPLFEELEWYMKYVKYHSLVLAQGALYSLFVPIQPPARCLRSRSAFHYRSVPLATH